jgi:hypothetical protein
MLIGYNEGRVTPRPCLQDPRVNGSKRYGSGVLFQKDESGKAAAGMSVT